MHRELGIDPDIMEKNDLHVHVPAGATPKDGPSAGVAVAAAIASALTDRPIPPRVAMTGELSLAGRVLPVGGIKEKVLAALRAGVKVVMLPTENKAELEKDVPPEMREKLVVEYPRDARQALQFLGILQ